MRYGGTLALVGLLSIASAAFAQAPPTGPLILHIPASARTAALGNAWVAGRDQDVIFQNPAQLIGVRSGFDLSVTRLPADRTMASIGSVFAAGKWSLTFGWGAQMLGSNADAATDVLLTAGAAILLKGFRIGAAGKYVSEVASNQQVWLADIGVARNLFGGAAALAVQNIGGDSTSGGTRFVIPRQLSLGWSRTKQAGPFDLAFFSQVSVRNQWTAPAAGLEVGYSWIEGYTVMVRAGAKRAETPGERPLGLGAAFTADRLTAEYSVRFFDGGRSAHGVTIRWR